MIVNTSKSLHRGHWLDISLVQLPALLFLGVLIPTLIWVSIDNRIILETAAINTVSASSIATGLTWYSLEQLRYFAKARRLSYVFPVNLTTFALCFAIIGVLRLPYSNAVAVLNFGSVAALTYVIVGVTRKSGVVQRIVPGGNVARIVTNPSAFAVLRLQDLKNLVANPDRRSAVVADLHHSHSSDWEEWIAEAAIKGIAVYHYRQILEMQSGQVQIDHLRENNFGSLIPNLAYTTLKRGIDLVSSILLLPVLFPLFVSVSILIKLESPGPAFFRQQRIGFRGNTFWMIKFRSMVVREAPKDNADQIDDAITKDSDVRITRVGAFIRRYRIDELPQIFCILKGEMSWIGPRPEAQSLSLLYQQKIPFYRYRHIVRPGITGWAQVNQGHVAAIDEVVEKLSFDFYYVQNISLWLDLLIVLKTIRTIGGGFGAK